MLYDHLDMASVTMESVGRYGGGTPGTSEEESSGESSCVFWRSPCIKDTHESSILVNTPPTPSNHSRRRTSICTGCREEIIDRFILHVQPNMEFHASCLKCALCHVVLNESCSAYVKNGMTYCREDYLRLFGSKCSQCKNGLEWNEMVMRAHNHPFHIHCFKCSSCQRLLQTGDEFILKGDVLFCRNGCTPIIHEPSISSSLFTEDESWETSTMISLDAPISTSPVFSSPKSEGVLSPPSFTSTPTTVPLPPSSTTKKHKKDKSSRQTTRVRTVLNETQLTILKRCYNQNQRPDAIVKEQLVEMTGLNARVIRVWFQNKRCKDKKRQIQQRDSEVNAARERALHGVRLQGVGPLVAASPSTHMEPSLGPPIDIHHFPQWNTSEGCPPCIPMGPPSDSFIQPMSYTELSSTNDCTPMPFHPQFPPFSPSCSE